MAINCNLHCIHGTLEFFLLPYWNLHLLTSIYPEPLRTTTLDLVYHHSALYFCNIKDFRFHRWVRAYGICQSSVSTPDYILLNIMISKFSHVANGKTFPFWIINNIPKGIWQKYCQWDGRNTLVHCLLDDVNTVIIVKYDTLKMKIVWMTWILPNWWWTEMKFRNIFCDHFYDAVRKAYNDKEIVFFLLCQLLHAVSP